ncbi:MAG: tetratricopeptide repeat protein [Geminicoccaceae bacterium]
MQDATDATVLGDFDDATFELNGDATRFFRRDGKFWINTPGPDGKPQDYELRHTFGVSPLQQYLLELPGGRLQSFGIAWDSRPKEQGGQRWFHLYGDDPPPPGDPLHWTGLQQNWNFMCADCHTTALKKNYDAATRSYDTQWSELGVGCESCHGPGGSHMTWAAKSEAQRSADTTKGLTVSLDERKGIGWSLDPATGKPVRNQPRNTAHELEVCGRCHARRAQLTDEVVAGEPFADGFDLALLDPQLFHSDGQMKDEVFNLGSFLQSRMHAEGVTCSDCHDPHSGKTLASGNDVCTQCHDAPKYDAAAHHFHTPGTPGAQCAACHMPTTTYMVVDPRHDHSFRIPRPDLSVTLGTPNACNTCHSDKSPQWSADAVAAHSGGKAPGFQTFAAAFARSDAGAPGAGPLLAPLVTDPAQPGIVRASALQRLLAGPDPLAPDLLGKAAADPDPLVRAALAAGLAQAAPATKLAVLPKLLDDPVRLVRIDAARALATIPTVDLPPAVRKQMQPALDEYVAVQRFNADRPEAQSALGTLAAARGDMVDAEQSFLTATELDRTYVPAWANLADAQRAAGLNDQAEATLRQGLAANPDSAPLHYALGLTLVRKRDYPGALQALGDAARLGPEDPNLGYVYAVALHDLGKPGEAMRVLDSNLKRHPDDRRSLLALASFRAEAGDIEGARSLARRLLKLAPNDPEVRQLLEALGGLG